MNPLKSAERARESYFWRRKLFYLSAEFILSARVFHSFPSPPPLPLQHERFHLDVALYSVKTDRWIFSISREPWFMLLLLPDIEGNLSMR